ncbi:MAG: hypothetical protein RJB01_1405 [Actinomycetota bacterium]
MDDRQVRIQGAIDDLVGRADADAELRARLLADPMEVIWLETGMRVPEHWGVIAQEIDGSVESALSCDELPDDYLEWVAGGRSGSGNTLDYRGEEECGFFKTLPGP